VPTKLLYQFPPQEDGEGEKLKWKRTHESRYRQFNKVKAEVVRRSKGNQKIFFSISHKQVISSHFPGSRASVRVVIALEDKCLNNESLSPFSFLSAVIAEQASHGMEYPLRQFELAILAMSPPRILPTPLPTE